MLDEMSLKKIQAYSGRNPRPADFDEYWDKALAEMWAIDPDVKITPSDFQAPGVECYDLYFTGVHGARVYAKYAKPKNVKGKMPAVLMFHGYSAASVNWISSLLVYAYAGFSVFALDCRGQGGKSEDVGGVHGTTHRGHIIRGLDDDDPNRLLYRDIFLDTAELARIAMDMDDIDETKVAATGGSQGGALTIACAALEPRIRFACPEYPFLCDYKGVWEMELANSAYEEIKEYFRHFDPRHEREEEIFTKLGYIDIQHLAPRIKADVLMFSGMMDRVCPPASHFAAYNNMTCKKEFKIWPDYGHEPLPGALEMKFQRMLEMAGFKK